MQEKMTTRRQRTYSRHRHRNWIIQQCSGIGNMYHTGGPASAYDLSPCSRVL